MILLVLRFLLTPFRAVAWLLNGLAERADRTTIEGKVLFLPAGSSGEGDQGTGLIE